jgi:SAM-dependent methyltransferase
VEFEMTTDYRQRIYDSYLRSSAHYYQKMVAPEVYEMLRPFYRSNHGPWLPADRRAPVIHVGCGAGHCLYFLQKEGFENAEGLDASEEMLRQCQVQGLKHLTRGSWREHLPAKPGTYGAIIAGGCVILDSDWHHLYAANRWGTPGSAKDVVDAPEPYRESRRASCVTQATAACT